MSSKAARRRERLARRRRAAQEMAISYERARRKRWGDGQIFGENADLPPMRDVSEVVSAREEPWPMVIVSIPPPDVHWPIALASIDHIPMLLIDEVDPSRFR